MYRVLIPFLLFFIYAVEVQASDCYICHVKTNTYLQKKLTFQDLVLINAEKYLYVRELTNNNDAPEIDKFLTYLGLPKHLPWCSAYVVYVCKEAADSLQIKNPIFRTGKVSSLWEFSQENELRYKTFDSEEVLSGEIKLTKSDIPIWASGLIKNNDFSGHTGLVRYQINKDKFATIEGNTTPGDKGNQREGGGVYERERKLAIGSKFQVLGFIRVR